MLDFEDFTIDEARTAVVSIDRDEKKLEIAVKNTQGIVDFFSNTPVLSQLLKLDSSAVNFLPAGVIAQEIASEVGTGLTNIFSSQDVITYNLDGWSGRYGKPLEFMLALHLSTMAPDLAYTVATDDKFDTTVHIKFLKAKLNIETTIDGKTLRDIDTSRGVFKEDGNQDCPYAKKPDGGFYTKNEVYEALKKANDKEFWTYIPYISWVEKHWFRDVYFDVDLKDITLYTEKTEGEKSPDSIEIVQKELMEDGELWDKYASLDEDGYSEELETETITDGVHVYRIVENDDYSKYSDFSDWYNSVIGDDSILKGMANVNVSINGAKIVQVADAKRGATNAAIKELFVGEDGKRGTDDDPTYYIYDGSSWTADAIEEAALAEDDSLKRRISLNKDSLAAFSILEGTHTLDADYIYKDFKELLVELKYFKQDEMIGLNLKVLKWLLPDYKDEESGYQSWPDMEVDKDTIEFGTLITSKANYDNKEKADEANENNDNSSNSNDDSTSSNNDSDGGKKKNTGFEEGIKVVSPVSGTVEATDGGIKIKIEGKNKKFEEYSEEERYKFRLENYKSYVKSTDKYNNICDGYDLYITGFNASVTSGKVEAGDEIGTTTSDNIKISMKNDAQEMIENIEDYFIRPGEEVEPKEKLEDEEVSDLTQYTDNNPSGGNSNNGSGDNTGGNGGSNTSSSGETNYTGATNITRNNNPITSHSYRHYSSGVMSAGEIQEVLNRLDQYLPIIEEMAKKYGVDPSWIMAIICEESRANANADSGANCYGLMQYWTGNRTPPYTAQELFDPRTNIELGTQLLKTHMNASNGSVYHALGRYIGEGNWANSIVANGFERGHICNREEAIRVANNLISSISSNNGFVQAMDEWHDIIVQYYNFN